MTNSINAQLIHMIPADKPTSFVIDKYLFVICRQSCSIFDITEKKLPVHLSDIELTKDKHGAAASPLRAVTERVYFQIGYSGIEVFDFQNPLKPFRIGMVENIITDQHHFLATHYLFGRKPCTLTQINNLILYDMHNPLMPSVSCDFNKVVTSILIVGNCLFLASQEEGLDVYDIATRSAPIKIANFNLNAFKLFKISNETILAETNNGLYLLDIRIPSAISVKLRFRLKGHLVLVENGYLFTWYNRQIMYGYCIDNDTRLKEVFSIGSAWVVNQISDGNLLLLHGIKNYDGVSALPNYDTQRYSLFKMQNKTITPYATIDFNRIWFSSYHLFDHYVYISRPDGIYIYQV